MAKTRKISECVNVRINVGNFQHIEITRHGEEEISYETEAERLAFEEELTNDLITGIIRSMKTIPEKLGKGVANAQEVEESIAKAIPEWLDNCKVPNLADKSNQAKDQKQRVATAQKENKDATTPNLDSPSESSKSTMGEPTKKVSALQETISEEDLFEDDDPVAEAVVEPEAVEPEVVVEPEAVVEPEVAVQAEEVPEVVAEVEEVKQVEEVKEDSSEKEKVTTDEFDFEEDDDDFDLFKGM